MSNVSSLSIADIGLAILSAGAGLQGARYWRKSSVVSCNPSSDNAPPDQNIAVAAWIIGMLKASEEASKLNVTAARWTALATVLGVVTTLLPIFGSMLG